MLLVLFQNTGAGRTRCRSFLGLKGGSSTDSSAPTNTKVDGDNDLRGSSEFGWKSPFIKLNQKNERVLTYYGMMFAGAIARSASAAAVHPLNVVKTMLQTKNGVLPEMTMQVLTRGAGSQFLMSIPHGALNYACTETIRIELAKLAIDLELSRLMPRRVLESILDFLSSVVSTFTCSIVSTPQMVITDLIMVGRYKHFREAVYQIFSTQGISGFYRGWFSAILQKIPSYALTWVLFQHIKTLFLLLVCIPSSTFENIILGSLAATGACCAMIPIDTIKVIILFILLIFSTSIIS